MLNTKAKVWRIEPEEPRLNLSAKNWILKILKAKSQPEIEVEPDLRLLKKAEMAEVVVGLHRPLVVFVDYDGTLFPIVRRPELACPDSSLLMLLKKLSQTPGVELHIISGRRFEELYHWFHKLPIHIHAEHGGISYDPHLKSQSYVLEPLLDNHLMQNVQSLFETFRQEQAGILIEKKSYSTVLHYRMADIDDNEGQLVRWKQSIEALAGFENLDIKQGDKNLEVCIKGLSKSHVFQERVHRFCDSNYVVIGNNCLDEEILRTVKGSCLTLSVGYDTTQTHYILRDCSVVREFLRILVGHLNKTPMAFPLNTHSSDVRSRLD